MTLTETLIFCYFILFRMIPLLDISANIVCPDAYMCQESTDFDAQVCVPVSVVCDGNTDCVIGDDEIGCGESRGGGGTSI